MKIIAFKPSLAFSQLTKLPVRRNRIVHDGLKGTASKVGRHGLELGETRLLNLEVVFGNDGIGRRGLGGHFGMVVDC